MKSKAVWCAAALSMASVASAGVLQWQVNPDAWSTGTSSVEAIDGTTGGNMAPWVSNAYNDWAYAGITAYSQAIPVSDYGNAAANASYYTYSQAENSTLTVNMVERQALEHGDAWLVSMDDTGTPAIDSGSYASQVFYIELYDSDMNVVGRSNDYLYFDGDKLVSSNGSGTDFLSTAAFQQNAALWNGGAKFIAVPEPTSGLMVLFGAAILGLRRKRRA